MIRSAHCKTLCRNGLPALLVTSLALTAAARPVAAQIQPGDQFASFEVPGLPGSTPWSTSPVATGDIDGDGDVDLVWGTGGLNALLINDGRGWFEDESTSRLPPNSSWTNAVALADVDQDGDLDLLCTNYRTGSSGEQDRLYFNDGTGHFVDVTVSHLPALQNRSMGLTCFDADSDGDLDLILGVIPDGFDLPVARLYRNDGAGIFTDTAPPPAQASAGEFLPNDLDGDGDLDLLMREASSWGGGGFSFFVNDGAGNFSRSQNPIHAVLANSADVADIDGDGDLDLVFGPTSNRPISGSGGPYWGVLFVNSGNGVFTDVTATNLPTIPWRTSAVRFGDVDGDGDADLLISEEWGRVSLLRNDGSGVFTTASQSLPVRAETLTLCDVDADADADLIVPGQIFANLQRQLVSNTPPTIGQQHTFEVYARPSTPGTLDLVLPFLSDTRTSIPLPPFGTVGIDPILALAPVVVSPATGVAAVTWSVPDLPASRGLDVFAQALMISVPTDAHLTNVAGAVIR